MTAAEPVYSAKGTRLNRRGLETRQHILSCAVRLLAEGGDHPVTSGDIARDAGVTWGTIQHQFGDLDGLWAAVTDHCCRWLQELNVRPMEGALPDRVTEVIDAIWAVGDSEEGRAVWRLRAALPMGHDSFGASYPLTLQRFLDFEVAWNSICDRLIGAAAAGGISDDQRRRLRAFLPGAVHGVHALSLLTPVADPALARQGLIDAVVAYLAAERTEAS
jgi:AcrR family transcriptional regulator